MRFPQICGAVALHTDVQCLIDPHSLLDLQEFGYELLERVACLTVLVLVRAVRFGLKINESWGAQAASLRTFSPEKRSWICLEAECVPTSG